MFEENYKKICELAKEYAVTTPISYWQAEEEISKYVIQGACLGYNFDESVNFWKKGVPFKLLLVGDVEINMQNLRDSL